MEYYFRIAVAINAVPFTYDKNRRRFRFSTDRLRYIPWVIVVFTGILIETVQVGWELLRAKSDSAVSRGEWALMPSSSVAGHLSQGSITT